MGRAWNQKGSLEHSVGLFLDRDILIALEFCEITVNVPSILDEDVRIQILRGGKMLKLESHSAELHGLVIEVYSPSLEEPYLAPELAHCRN